MGKSQVMSEYANNMVEYIHSVRGGDKAKIMEFAKEKTQAYFKDRKVKNVIVSRPGQEDVEVQNLWDFISDKADTVIAPSGSIYKSATVQKSFIAGMLEEVIEERNHYKLEQFKAVDSGDKVLEAINYNAQSRKKIFANSLPGGKGSPYNIFYDKGGYNATTSFSRELISHAFTVCEQLLGGNFGFFDERTLLNHIIVNIRLSPSEEELIRILNKYKLMVPTTDQLFDFYKADVHKYQPRAQLKKVYTYLESLSTGKTAYLYYFGNLRHLIWDNHEFFKPWLHSLMDIDKIPAVTDATNEELFAVDEDLNIAIRSIYNHVFDGIPPWDFPTKKPEYVAKYVGIARHMNKMLGDIQELMDTFITYPTLTPNIGKKKFMWRNTVIVSDTDSVIFTSKHWMLWFTGTDQKYDIGAYQITAMTIYWVTKAMAHTMKKFSIAKGAVGKNIGRIILKNEFLYATMIIYEAKKTYAGIVTIQEGAVLVKPTADLKGVAIRSSNFPPETAKFVKEFIIEHILNASIKGPIHGRDLIQLTIDREKLIRQSLLDGKTDFLKISSIKPEDQYKNPSGSQYQYCLAWNEVYGKKYEIIRVPTKAYTLPLKKITSEYLDYLKETDIKIHNNTIRFIEKHKKFPNLICIDLDHDSIPKELIPLIDYRKIIYFNLKPNYLTMSSLSIDVGFEKKQLLMSEIYPEL